MSLPRGRALFWALHLAVVAAALWLYGQRARELATAGPTLPPLRPAPLAVEPLYDEPSVIGEGDLARLLSRLGLPFEEEETSIGLVDHSLRMWGLAAEPLGAAAMSGAEMLRLLIDHRRFEEVYGRGVQPLLAPVAGGGARFRTLEGPATSPHVDHTLATLAEIGLPLAQPMRAFGRDVVLRDVLEQSLRDFSLNQPEYEWSALGFALFVVPSPAWATTEGQRIDFDLLAERIMREPLPNGVCSGNHRLYALATLLQVDAGAEGRGEPRLLDPATRAEVLDYLRGITATFVRHQHPDGFWNGDWPISAPPGREPTASEEDSLANRLIVTGHVLEWWAISPEELLPPREVAIDAARWLVATVDGLTDEQIQENYSYLTHVGRALALWRGRLPGAVPLTAG